jgi:hypothetical protein
MGWTDLVLDSSQRKGNSWAAKLMATSQEWLSSTVLISNNKYMGKSY